MPWAPSRCGPCGPGNRQQVEPSLEAWWGTQRLSALSVFATVAINLIVQHIQDILSGDLCKWQRGANGRSYKRTFPEPGDRPGVLTSGKRSHLESSSRPH